MVSGIPGWASSASTPVPTPLFVPEAFYDPLVLQWAGGLLLLQVVLYGLCLLVPSKKVVAKAGLVAHQLCLIIPFLYSSYLGFKLFVFEEDATVAALGAGTYADRIYGNSAICWHMNRYFLGFQVYDLIATLFVPSLCKFEHILHHTLSMLTALAGTSGPMMQWYAPFYFGFVEVSSVPLAFVDLFRAVPPAPGGVLSACNELVRVAFALSFLPIRCYIFPRQLLVYVYPDAYAAYMANDVRGPIALSWFVISGTMLSALQLFWGFKIVRVLIKQFVLGKRVDPNKEA